MTESSSKMKRNPFDLTGRTALVTGGNQGLGRAFAFGLADAGATVAIAGRSAERNATVVAEAAEAGHTMHPITADITKSDDVARMTAEAIEALGHVDVLVNNAGTIERTPAAEHPLEMWDRVLSVNLDSQFVLTQAVGRSMIARGYGKVVFTASLLSFQGGVNVPGYVASKSAIAGLTKALANEWTSLGVNVNALAPGYIATDNTQALQDDPARSRSILERIPAGRWGQASDLGGAAVFLASPASDYVSGITLPVDGGWLGR